MTSEAKQPILIDNDSTCLSLLSWPFLKHRFLPELMVVFLMFDALFGSSVFANGRRIAHEDGTGKFFYHNDHLGSPVVITDSSGNDTRFFEYFPYGTVKSETDGSVPNPNLLLKHKFNSKELDDITGLYDYGARQYDAQLGRFITPDFIDFDLENPQSFNRYSYTYNNPLKYIDPTGNIPLTPFDALDLAFLAADIQAVRDNPSLFNKFVLGIDIVLTALPVAPAVAGLAVRGGKSAAQIGKALASGERAAKALKGSEGAVNVTGKTFSRFMTKAEARAVKDSNVLRGGREGETFFTSNKFQKVSSAQQKLSLPEAPEVRLDFKVKNQPLVSSRPVEPRFGQPGGGKEFVTKDPVAVKVVREKVLRSG